MEKKRAETRVLNYTVVENEDSLAIQASKVFQIFNSHVGA
jgi:hypothetical protein